MKQIIIFLGLFILLFSCESKENIIKKKIQEDLFSQTSYVEFEPYKIEILPAYQTPENDSLAFNLAHKILMYKIIKESLDTKLLEIGVSAKKKSYMIKNSADNNNIINEALTIQEMVDYANSEIKSNEIQYNKYIKSLDPSQCIGYRVFFSYRGKLADSSTDFKTFIYIFDKNLEKILYKTEKLQDYEDVLFYINNGRLPGKFYQNKINLAESIIIDDYVKSLSL